MLADWSFGDLLWGMLIFFFWFMAIWIFISLFADIFHREDLSGIAKAGWIFLIFVVPFLGALIYIIARPKMTPQDKRDLEQMQVQQRRLSGGLPTEEIARAAELHDKGTITDAEFEEIKRRALM
jgi:hypothetical protein